MTAPRVTSELEIINIALEQLSQRPISSIDENNEKARLALGTFAQYRESEMGSFSWNCCTKYAACPSATLPAGTFGWTTAFTLPSDCLAIWNVENESDADGDDWTRQGDILLTNIVTDTTVTSINVRYTWENLVVASWDSSLIDAIVSRCEMEWSEPLRSTSTNNERTEMKYKDRRGKARHTESIQGSAKNFETSRWTRARS